jgi:hypothetical protein
MSATKCMPLIPSGVLHVLHVIEHGRRSRGVLGSGPRTFVSVGVQLHVDPHFFLFFLLFSLLTLHFCTMIVLLAPCHVKIHKTTKLIDKIPGVSNCYFLKFVYPKCAKTRLWPCVI